MAPQRSDNHQEIPNDEGRMLASKDPNLLLSASEKDVKVLIDNRKELFRDMDITIEYQNLSFIVKVPLNPEVSTVATTLTSMMKFWETKPTKEIRILSNVTGRIAPRKMTLLLGPPGSGKSVLLKALAGRLYSSNAVIEGEVYYDGDNIKSGKFLPGKVANYVEQGDTLEPALTVEETIKFAWQTTTGGHHAYGVAKDTLSAAVLNEGDPTFVAVTNILTGLGLNGCKDTFVGDGMIRGVSGGQKRRVTIGETVVTTKPIGFYDSISNGLDALTTLDIVKSIKLFNETCGTTILISLLQPTPDVFNLFDEVLILSEGEVIYHGNREAALSYFAGIGYHCPEHMDIADFLQELPTPYGKRFHELYHKKDKKVLFVHNTATLAQAWLQSSQYTALLSSMTTHMTTHITHTTTRGKEEEEKKNDVELGGSDGNEGTIPLSIPTPIKKNRIWPMDTQIAYPHHYWYYFILTFSRQFLILIRNSNFLIARIMQCLVMGLITGSLFYQIDVTNIPTMNGFIFQTLLFSAVTNFAMIPLVYKDKLLVYKHSESYFYPISTFTLSQVITLFPFQLIETFVYGTIVYYMAGLSNEDNGKRYIIYIMLCLLFGMIIGQFFRVIAMILPDQKNALPLAGVLIVIMILFSGFIQPKALISNGWIWFYWLNPMSWGLKAVCINEFKSSKYDNIICINEACTSTGRYGDVILEQYGNPTNESYIVYCFIVLIGEYIAFFLATYLALYYIRSIPNPLPPIREEEEELEAMVLEQRIEAEEQEEEVEAVVEKIAKKKKSMQYAMIPTCTATVPINVLPSFAMVPLNDHNNDIEAQSSQPQDQEEEPQLPMPMSSSAQLSSSKQYEYEELPFQEISFAFNNISYTVPLPSSQTGEELTLLNNIQGYFLPGTMTALMGSSGAGKTTLLDVLAGRKNTGSIKGSMYLNGIPKQDAYFRKIMGYVEQFDSLPSKATPREVIEFSAALRLDSQMITKPQQRELWVNAILTMLDLIPLEHQLIGDAAEGGMSFEQRKRISIGIELAANPSILFLDEPTTGLDSRAAQSLIQHIRHIANTSKRSIVCTIHQPSTAIFYAFDSLLLLRRGGETVYFGELGNEGEQLIGYFEKMLTKNNSHTLSSSLSLSLPKNMNPATWMLEIIGSGHNSNTTDGNDGNTEGTSEKKKKIAIDHHDYYLTSTLYQTTNEQLITLITPDTTSQSIQEEIQKHTINISNSEEYPTTNYTQIKCLYQRISRTYWRTPSYTLGRIFTNIFLALIFASAYPFQEYTTYVGVQSRAGVIYITTYFCGILAMLTVIPIIFAERPIFYREQQSRMYRIINYTIVMFVIELPYILLNGLAFTLPFFYIVGFDGVGNKIQKFFWYLCFQTIFQALLLFLGEFLVVFSSSEMISQVLVGLCSTSFSLFCGYLITPQTIPAYWIWMYWMNPLHYCLEGIITAMFHQDDTVISLMDGSLMTAESYISDELYTTWTYGHVGYDLLALGGFTVFFVLGMYLCLSYLRHDKR